MKPLKAFDVQFVGLKLGAHIFEYDIEHMFFEHFEYDEFNDVQLKTTLNFQKKTTLLELDFEIDGTVNINCDLTNEAFNLPIKSNFSLIVKFGSEYNDDNEEILIVPHGEFKINVAHYIYELIVLSVPQKRLHPGIEDGTLNSDILETLEDLSPKSLDNKNSDKDTDPRWDSLKKLLTDK
ncbi:MAG: DUF177 domain-containing protein [Bacteroidetes bacterium]|nr:DUF177 domain-containing protein [Bacteroidota bacterium]